MASSKLCHYRKFYYLRMSAKTETVKSHVVDASKVHSHALSVSGDQRCMRSSVVLVDYDNFTFDQFWPLIVDSCNQFVQLLNGS